MKLALLSDDPHRSVIVHIFRPSLRFRFYTFTFKVEYSVTSISCLDNTHEECCL